MSSHVNVYCNLCGEKLSPKIQWTSFLFIHKKKQLKQSLSFSSLCCCLITLGMNLCSLLLKHVLIYPILCIMLSDEWLTGLNYNTLPFMLKPFHCEKERNWTMPKRFFLCVCVCAFFSWTKTEKSTSVCCSPMRMPSSGLLLGIG